MYREVVEAWRYREVAQNFVKTSLGVRYRRSLLGYLWSVLSPLAKYAIMGVIFEVIGRFAMPNYYGFMFIGSVFFGFVSTVVTQSTLAFISNEHYIKKIYVPKLIYIVNVVLNETVNFVLVLIAIVMLLLAMGQLTVGLSWLFLPIALIITVVGLVGIGTLVAIATIYFRDIQHLSDILFQALFFATPIFYPLSALSKDPVFYAMATANPLLYLVNLFRMPLVDNRFPDLASLLISLTISLVLAVSGLFVLKAFNNRIVFKL
jgi:ABC-2 type transport system permease protein/lipopolysaccharide transport system permease protein